MADFSYMQHLGFTCVVAHYAKEGVLERRQVLPWLNRWVIIPGDAVTHPSAKRSLATGFLGDISLVDTVTAVKITWLFFIQSNEHKMQADVDLDLKKINN